MPHIEIGKVKGGPLDCFDEFGADYDITELNDKLVRIKHATRDQVTLEIVHEMPPVWPSTFFFPNSVEIGGSS